MAGAAAALMMFFYSLTGCAYTPPPGNPLDGPWEYAAGNLKDGVKDAERLGYRPLDRLSSLERLVPGGHGTLWLKKRFSVPDRLRTTPLSIMLGTILPADETYLNGTYIGGYGKFPYGGKRFFSDWNRVRRYNVPQGMIGPGENVLLVKIYVEYEGAIDGIVAIGERTSISRIYRIEEFIRYSLNLVVSFFMIGIGLYLLMIYVKRPMDRENLYYAVSCILFMPYHLNFYATRLPFPVEELIDYFLFQKIVYGTTCLSFFFLIRFVNRFLGFSMGRMQNLAVNVITILPAAVIFAMPDYRMMVAYGKVVLSLFTLLALLFIIGVNINGVIRRVRRAGVLLLGLAPLVLGILIDITVHVVMGRTETVYVSGFGVAGYFFAVGFVLADDFVNYHNRVEVLNADLEKRIRERQKAEDLLSAERDRLMVTLGSIAEAVVATDIEGCVNLMNDVARRLFSAEDKKSDEGGPLRIDVLNPDMLPAGAVDRGFEFLSKLYARARSGGGPFETLKEAVDVPEAGGKRILAGSGSPIRGSDGRVAGYVFIIRDVTEEERQLDEILKIRKLESIGILAGGIAHDFNNILTAVLGNISMARQGMDMEGEPSKILEDAEKAVLRAEGLTKQLLTFSRGGEPVKQVMGLEGLIRDAAGFVLRGSKARCAYRIEKGSFTVEADRGQIAQVIQNLVINAMQAMPEGGEISIGMDNVRVEEADRLPLVPGDYVRIAVSDTGSGIEPGILTRIFDPYFTTKINGSGLGLASSYSIVKNHGGHIIAESMPGKGAVFFVYLPATGGKPASDGVPERRRFFVRGRVLLMDDDEHVIQAAARMFEYCGLDVTATCDGASAVRAYGEAYGTGSPYDLVVLDLTIPGGMGGMEALTNLKSIDPSVKAVVSSGYSNDSIMSDYAAHGFCGVISKPYRLDDISALVDELMIKRRESGLG